jgi:hypothetical protein
MTTGFQRRVVEAISATRHNAQDIRDAGSAWCIECATEVDAKNVLHNERDGDSFRCPHCRRAMLTPYWESTEREINALTEFRDWLLTVMPDPDPRTPCKTVVFPSDPLPGTRRFLQHHLYDTQRLILRRTSGGPERERLGQFYIIDERTREIVRTHVDIQAELAALAPSL